MAASDVFYRDQRMLNRVFAVSSVAMLITVVWMFADDFKRPYKQDQIAFRTVEEEMNKRALLSMAPSAADQDKIVASETAVTAVRNRVQQLKPLVDEKVKSLIPKRATLDSQMRNIKADYDSKISYFNIAVEHHGPEHADAKKFREEAEKEWAKLQKAKPEMEALEAEIAQASNEEIALPDGTKTSLNQAQRELKALEASHKKLTGEFDRFLKVTAQKKWTWKDSLRSMPVLDGFASPVKIKQTFHDDLPIDYGGFKYVTRYDRCATCHLGIDKPSFDIATLTRLTMNPGDDADLQQKASDAKKLLVERQKANTDSKQDVNVLAERDLEPKQVKLTKEQVKEFAVHPRLDLFVDATSPHAAEKFGCTICHAGQGSATTFFDAAHSPNDIAMQKEWSHDLHWHPVHSGDWELPMQPARFIESSCLKCHHQVEDLVRDGSRVEAEKLVKGYHLVKDLGCFGCHEIHGNKSGRPVGPDMRLEPEPPLESLSPAERAKRLADTANAPGTMRKVGPSLLRVAEKTTEDWAAKWIKAPRVFRPDTKMPHFYLQTNNVDEALPPEQKKFPDAEIRAVTHYLFAKSRVHLANVGLVAKQSATDREADDKLYAEANAKLADGSLSDASKAVAQRTIKEIKARMALRGQPAPVEDAIHLPNAPANEAASKEQLDRGRHLFATRGCVACHRNENIESAGQTSTGGPAPAMVGESIFGPELSKVAAKLGRPGAADSAKKWLVQWLQNPMVHSPRTLMPVTHLTINEANDVAAWLLSQPAKPDAEWDTLTVAPPDPETLAEMARMYLRKAGMTSREVEAAVKNGFSKEELAYRAEDADEQELSAPLNTDKLMTYIGKKAIGNLGCYACHTIPGFESAKPIGVGLNDWGKKDVDRIAFEDAEHYIQERFHVVDMRDDPKDKSKADADWKAGDGTQKPLEKFAPYETAKQPPYEKFFADMMGHEHRKREGFLHLKLMAPRSYDYNRLRDWNDRARMPQFKFARTKRLPDEPEEAFKLRSEREEALGREAAMTFVLGMIAEPIPGKFLPSYAPDRAAEIRGRAVIEKFNCSSCHLIRPGVYEMSLTDDVVKGPDGKVMMVEVADKDGKTRQVPLTNKKAVLDRLTLAHQAYMGAEQGDPKGHSFTEHNAWETSPQTGDKLTVRGVLGTSTNDAEGGVGPSLRPTSATTYKDADGSIKTIPASPSFGIPFVAGPMKEVGEPYHGSFALQLKRYLSELDPKVYGDVQPLNKYDDESGKGPDGYAAIPPSLLHEGERVQPNWLYEFLLNPRKIRKIPPLQMPKFSMSDDEATALVNYFTAANKLGNPGVGLHQLAKVPQRDEAYLAQKTKEYVARLKANNLFEERVNEMKPLWARVAREQMAAADARVAGFKAAKDDAKAAEAQKEADRWRSQLGANDFPTLKSQWEEREAYVADAWKLVTYTGNLCITCHQVGPAIPNEYRAPDLDIAWQRLRPEWTERWIANPQRLMPYASLMPLNYKPSEAKKHSDDAKVFLGTPDDLTTASRDLLMMFPMVADWPVIKYRVGPTAFGAPAAPPK